MGAIELSPLDKKDLLELLEYAKKQKSIKKPPRNSVEHWDDSNWWIMRIEQLEMVINGKNVQNSLIQSSYGTIDCEMSSSDKSKLKYRKSLEEDIFGIFDNQEEELHRDNLL